MCIHKHHSQHPSEPRQVDPSANIGSTQLNVQCRWCVMGRNRHAFQLCALWYLGDSTHKFIFNKGAENKLLFLHPYSTTAPDHSSPSSGRIHTRDIKRQRCSLCCLGLNTSYSGSHNTPYYGKHLRGKELCNTAFSPKTTIY